MRSSLSTQLTIWQRQDLRNRLEESVIRGLCWALFIAGAAPEGVRLLAGGIALGGEAWMCWRAWRIPEAIAAEVDAAGNTHGLLRTALAAEQDRAWGAPSLIALVHQQAEAAVPALAPHAVRSRKSPRAPLAVGLLGLVLLMLRDPTDERAPEDAAFTDSLAAQDEAAAEDAHADPGALPEDSRLVDGAGAMVGGDARAQAQRGEGEAGGTGAAGGGVSAGEARQGAQGAGDAGDKGGRPSDQGAGAAGSSASGDNNQTGGEQRGEMAKDDQLTSNDLDATVLEEGTSPADLSDANRDPYKNEQANIQSADMENSTTELDNAVGTETMAPAETSALVEDIEDIPTRTLGLALAGQGGINDAPGTVDLVAAPDADDVETAEAWIAARWRASAAGTLQTIDGGQSGGQSSQEWVSLYDSYASLAEARMHREEIPPGRRDYVRTYFESIRSDQ
ncbi:MAG: hypothetical protein P8R54_22315 [Myxococcota bacterium]|nr:hypothetical protein [Myxococcota bacterium]